MFCMINIVGMNVFCTSIMASCPRVSRIIPSCLVYLVWIVSLIETDEMIL